MSSQFFHQGGDHAKARATSLIPYAGQFVRRIVLIAAAYKVTVFMFNAFFLALRQVKVYEN